MTILDSILSAGNAGLVTQLAGQFGITPVRASSATIALLPAIGAGVQHLFCFDRPGPTGLSLHRKRAA